MRNLSIGSLWWNLSTHVPVLDLARVLTFSFINFKICSHLPNKRKKKDKHLPKKLMTTKFLVPSLGRFKLSF